MSAGKPIQVRLQDEELRALDEFRRGKLNPPSRAEALRDLARTALRGCGTSSNSRTIGHQPQVLR
jgi:hypothetical protein